MKKLINKLWLIFFFFAVFSMGILILLVYINQVNYLGVFDLSMISYLCVLPIIFAAIIIRRIHVEGEFGRLRMTMLAMTILMPLLASVLFQVFKPNYDVQAAVNRIESSSDFESVVLKTEYHLMSFTPRANWFVSTGYVFDARQGEAASTIIFNPVTGQFDIIEK